MRIRKQTKKVIIIIIVTIIIITIAIPLTQIYNNSNTNSNNNNSTRFLFMYMQIIIIIIIILQINSLFIYMLSSTVIGQIQSQYEKKIIEQHNNFNFFRQHVSTKSGMLIIKFVRKLK
jgi:ABC-type siderophore export system fused ATPase/permease subunit